MYVTRTPHQRQRHPHARATRQRPAEQPERARQQHARFLEAETQEIAGRDTDRARPRERLARPAHEPRHRCEREQRRPQVGLPVNGDDRLSVDRMDREQPGREERQDRRVPLKRRYAIIRRHFHHRRSKQRSRERQHQYRTPRVQRQAD